MYYLIPVITVLLVVSAWAHAIINKLPVVRLAQPSEIRTVVNSVSAFSDAYAALASMAANGTLRTSQNTKNLTFPAVDGSQSDGGAYSLSVAVTGFEPPALKGYAWFYGQHPVDATPESGRYYVCMQPLAAQFQSPSAVSAVVAASSSFSQANYVYSNSCGGSVDSAALTPANLRLTYYVSAQVSSSPGLSPGQGAAPPGKSPVSAGHRQEKGPQACKSRWDARCWGHNRKGGDD